VQGTVLAFIYDDTPHGYNLTFAFPALAFIIIAGVLYLILTSTHRVPGHVAMDQSRWAKGGSKAQASGPAAPGSSARAGNQGPADPDATQTVQHEPDEGAESGE
jgi:hypothetical protein